MNTMKSVFVCIGCFAAFLIVLFVLNSFGLFSYQFFGPKYEATRNDIFQNSQAYNDGMMRGLQDYQMQYNAADDTGKASIRAVVLQRYAGYRNIDQMPVGLRNFYYSLQNGR